jgi:hypothetical protein
MESSETRNKINPSLCCFCQVFGHTYIKITQKIDTREVGLLLTKTDHVVWKPLELVYRRNLEEFGKGKS